MGAWCSVVVRHQLGPNTIMPDTYWVLYVRQSPHLDPFPVGLQAVLKLF